STSPARVTVSSGMGGRRISALSDSMSRSVSMSVAPEIGGDRGQAAMQRHSHRALADSEAVCHIGDRMSLDGDRRHDGTLACRQTIERARQFPGTQGLVCWRSKRMRHVFDVHLGAATMPAARIDELVPRDCKYPRKDRPPRPPRVTLQVNGEQRLLHDVLRVDPGSGARQLRSEEHTSELQSRENLVCRLLL